MATDLPPADPRDLPAAGLPAPVTIGQGRTAVRLALAAQGNDLILTATGRTCVAIVGIHQDQATRAEIAAIVTNVQQGLARLEGPFVRDPTV